MSTDARYAAARAQRPKAAQAAARLGHAVNGLLNATIGALALGIVGTASEKADPHGALAGLASGPVGQALIWVIVVGMVALGLWQLASALQVRESKRGRRWLARVSLVGKGAAYLVIAAIAFGIALRGGDDSGGSEEDLTAGALATPGGVVLVVLAGLVAVAVGGYLIVKGLRRTFLDDLYLPGGAVGTATTVLGVVGYVARGVAIGVVGILFIAAAVTADSSQAGGLDDALATLAALPFGQVVLVAIGLGFIAYGVYGFVRARFAKL